MADAVVRHVVTFGRVLREAGLEVGPGRLADSLSGLDHVDLTRQDDVYWTLRQTLVARSEDLDAFDRAFAAWFLRAPFALEHRSEPPGHTMRLVRRAGEEQGGEAAGDDESKAGWSYEEILRERDFAELTKPEFARVRELIA